MRAIAALLARLILSCASLANEPDPAPVQAPADLSSQDMRPIGPKPSAIPEGAVPGRRLRHRVPARQAQ